MSEDKKATTEKSEEEETNSTDSIPVSDKEQKKSDPIRRITKIVLIVCLIIFIWYLFADRYTPFTDQARIKTLVVPLVPRVSGYLTEVNVRLHSIVANDQLLFQIDKRPYELAVKKAEADLDNVAQQIGVLTATVKSAAGRLGVTKAQLDRAQRNYDRTQIVIEQNPGALSQADLDRTETSLAQALERLVSAEADLDKAKQELGTTGPDNPQLRAAVVILEQAQLDLAFTSIHAPSKGVIESFNVDVGHYGQSGQAGDEVEFALDIAPGSIFDGKVRSIGYGVSSGENNTRGDLPTVSNSQGWLRDPQRFPVIIRINDEDILGQIRSGAQADVIIYTSSNPILNLIGWFQIRIKSWLSYVR